jgi:hypothetical protein
MPKVDMSAAAVTTRLKRVSQLRRLGLSLQKAGIKTDKDTVESSTESNQQSRKQDKSSKE